MPENTAAIDKAVARALKDQRKDVNTLIKDAMESAKSLEDKGQKKAVTDALKNLKAAIASPI